MQAHFRTEEQYCIANNNCYGFSSKDKGDFTTLLFIILKVCV